MVGQQTLHVVYRSSEFDFLHSIEIPNHLLLTYYEVLFSLPYDVIHLPGHLNYIADAGSRLFADEFSNLQGGKLVDESLSSFFTKRKNNSKEKGTPFTKGGIFSYAKHSSHSTNTSRAPSSSTNNIKGDYKRIKKVQKKEICSSAFYFLNLL